MAVYKTSDYVYIKGKINVGCHSPFRTRNNFNQEVLSMWNSLLAKTIKRRLTSYIIIALIVCLSSVIFFVPPVLAATTSIPINMVFYGLHDDTIDQRIINAHPEFLVDNSPAGPWKGNANIGKFKAAGIKYFEYLDGGYEGSLPRSIPNTLASNLNYITAAAQSGAYGIFLDEVSDGKGVTPNYTYLQQIASKARGFGLKVVFNTGMSNWADQLMNYCDYMNSSEHWNNESLTTSQSKWANRTWLLTQGVTIADTAANLTKSAWSKSIRAHYASESYTALPSWLESYVSQVKIAPDFSLTSSQTAISFQAGSSAAFSAAIIPVGGFNGTVTLKATSSSMRLTSSPTFTTVVSPYASRTFTLRSSTPGSYTLQITGTGGTKSHSVTIAVTVKSSR
jgi:hypothetical protein